MMKEQLPVWNGEDKEVLGKSTNEIDGEAKSLWDTVRPISSLIHLPHRLILVVV